MTRPSGPDIGVQADLAGQALDDALYYLGTDCVPCAERQFEKARRLGATESAIAAVRAKHAAAGRTLPGHGASLASHGRCRGRSEFP